MKRRSERGTSTASEIGRRLAAGAIALVGALALLAGGTVRGQEKDSRPPRPRASLQLFADPIAVLDANAFWCSIESGGGLCVRVFNTPAGQGGFWPTTRDGYVFRSGLAVAGIHAAGAGPWAGDTTFARASSTVSQHMAPLADVFDSRRPEDLAAWPEAALLRDETLFPPERLGEPALSEQDTWTRYWDGNPSLSGGRPHPLGVRVSQRSLAWNYPLGNESVLYFLFELENVTGDPEFQQASELELFAGDDALPDPGWVIDSLYAALLVDADVGVDVSRDASTAIFPFDLALSYDEPFDAPEFEYPPRFFRAPFFRSAPGLVGVKWLRSAPGEDGRPRGMTFWSVTEPDFDNAPSEPQSAASFWRHVAGRNDPALDFFVCNVEPTTPDVRPLCLAPHLFFDTRFHTATGPFTLGPGESVTLATAFLAAATLSTLPDGTPTGIAANQPATGANPPGIPSFHPGFGSRRGCDLDGLNCTVVRGAAENAVRPIERAAGWVDYDGPAPTSPLELPEARLSQHDVRTVPESLLGKALVAQTILDARFLLPPPPEPPPFFLIPGDDQVTVVWEPSPTEREGDPFFALASDPGSALYNPNYRRFDVEGYRILRGTSPDALEPIARFQHPGTRLADALCETVTPDENPAALTGGDSVRTITAAGDTIAVTGFAAGDLCPGDPVERDVASVIFNNGGPGGPPGGGVVRSAANLAAVGVRLDTVNRVIPPGPFVAAGVPFAFVDREVRDHFTYFYRVEAFDVNSALSGPISQTSGSSPRSAVPRPDASNLVVARLETFLAGDDGQPLDTDAALPELHPEDGTFGGPSPPTDAAAPALTPLVERLLPAFDLAIRVDSILPVASPGSAFGVPTPECARGGDPFHSCLRLHLTAEREGVPAQTFAEAYRPWWTQFGEVTPQQAQLATAEVAFDPDALRAFGFPSLHATAVLAGRFGEAILMSAAEGPQNRRTGGRTIHGGSRWFSGAAESVPDPARYIRVGRLDGVDSIWAPISHTPPEFGRFAPVGDIAFEKQCFSRAMAKLGRAADVRFTWQGGTVTVRDVTHRVDVPFSARAGASWGFLATDANGNGLLDWQDFNYVDAAHQVIRLVGGGNCDAANASSWDPQGVFSTVRLEARPALLPISFDGLEEAGSADLEAAGRGFGLYVNGERYLFRISAAPGDGTVWTLRTYLGSVQTPFDRTDTPDPGGYAFSPFLIGTDPVRPLVPGLALRFRVAEPSRFVDSADPRRVHTVPDPYLGTSGFGTAGADREVAFVHLPARATVRIYTLSGVLVRVLNHDDPTGGSRLVWDLRNRRGQPVASGIYFYHITTADGREHVGKMTVVNPVGSG